MSTTIQLLTADDVWRSPPKGRWELVNGEVRTMAPAGFEHGAVVMHLSYLIAKFVKENSLGVVVGAETGFILRRNPDSVRGADIAYVAASRIPPGGPPRGFFPGAPDLAVEVVSPFDSYTEVEEKVDLYISAGARLVWVVDPSRRTITVHEPRKNPIVLRGADTLDGGQVLPGFNCLVSAAFG